jgi:hypothetical protein
MKNKQNSIWGIKMKYFTFGLLVIAPFAANATIVKNNDFIFQCSTWKEGQTYYLSNYKKKDSLKGQPVSDKLCQKYNINQGNKLTMTMLDNGDFSMIINNKNSDGTHSFLSWDTLSQDHSYLLMERETMHRDGKLYDKKKLVKTPSGYEIISNGTTLTFTNKERFEKKLSSYGIKDILNYRKNLNTHIQAIGLHSQLIKALDR